ncbi:MAG: FtsX-like permease family protein [bacterium]|nr:FtsX-like permease family protein [bacterium]
MRPRYRKALRDLGQDRGRTALVLLALIVGVWGLSSVVVSTVIATRDLRDNYLVTNPASATLWVAGAGDAVATARSHPDVRDAELRTLTRGRIQVETDEWVPLHLFLVEDFESLRIARFDLEDGGWPEGPLEIAIERDARQLMPMAIGSSLSLRFPGQSSRRELRVSAIVHDPGQAPSHMEHWVYGYVSFRSARALGLVPSEQQLKITVAERPLDRAHIHNVARDLRGILDERGLHVSAIEVPLPGRHPHQGQLEALLLLQASIGGMALVLSGVLIINMLSALLARQVREIGIMKAVGAGPMQVMAIYFGMVVALALLALAIGLPLGIASGRGFAAVVAGQLNFKLLTQSTPVPVLGSLVLAGLALPLLAAAFPVWRGTRVSVQQALLTRGTSRIPRASSLFAGSGIGPRRLLMALRNAVRRPARMVLTVATLAVGLATFLVALNLRASLTETLRGASDSRPYDVEVIFEKPVSRGRIAEIVEGTQGVTAWEAWGGGRASLVYPDGVSPTHFSALFPPVGALMELPMLRGRWGAADGERAVVINQGLLEYEPGLRVGDSVSLRMRGQGGDDSTWTLAGIAKEVGSPPKAYLLNAAETVGGEALSLHLSTAEHGASFQRDVSRRLEARFENSGVDVRFSLSKAEDLQIIDDHLDLIFYFLTAASLFVLMVGGVGLVSTLSMNVLERRRETGILRSIGASNAAIVGLLVIEGEIAGALSWGLASLLAVPSSRIISDFFGNLILGIPLDFAVSATGMTGSAVLVVIFTGLVSAWPAWRVTRRSLPSVLAYE